MYDSTLNISFPVNQLYRLPLDMGGGVKSCDLTDPFAVVLLADGTVALLELCEGEEEEEGGGATLQLTWPDVVKVRSKVESLNLH